MKYCGAARWFLTGLGSQSCDLNSQEIRRPRRLRAGAGRGGGVGRTECQNVAVDGVADLTRQVKDGMAFGIGDVLDVGHRAAM
jgi:hypothetical protein